MKKEYLIKMVLGGVLMAGALAGTLMSVTGIYITWRVKPVVYQKASSGLDLSDRTVAATKELLEVVESSLENIHSSMEDIEAITADAAATIKSTRPVMTSVADLFGEDFSNVVEETQTSLGNASQSASVIDDTLSVITTIMSINPFQSAPAYSPENSLQSSIDQVSEKLDTLPATLNEVQGGMASTAEQMKDIEEDLENTSDRVADIKRNIEDAQAIIKAYHPVLTELDESIDRSRKYLDTALNAFCWAVSILMIWLVVAQIGLFTQGLDLFKRGRGTEKQGKG